MSDRKHLTTLEVDRLLAAAKGSRNEARDRCLLLLMFRHGLRVSEACGLRLSHVDTESRVLHVARLKKGRSYRQLDETPRQCRKSCLQINELDMSSQELHPTADMSERNKNLENFII